MQLNRKPLAAAVLMVCLPFKLKTLVRHTFMVLKPKDAIC